MLAVRYLYILSDVYDNVFIYLFYISIFNKNEKISGIVPLPKHRIDFSDSHDEGGSIAPKEDWTICTRYVVVE